MTAMDAGTRIFVVDDEPDVVDLFRQQFRRELRQGEWRLDFAGSTDAALAALPGEAGPDRLLVLSDINMPGRNGLELLAELKRRWPAVPVVMVTAYGDDATERRAYAMGASGFVQKPIDFPALKARLRAIAAPGQA